MFNKVKEWYNKYRLKWAYTVIKKLDPNPSIEVEGMRIKKVITEITVLYSGKEFYPHPPFSVVLEETLKVKSTVFKDLGKTLWDNNMIKAEVLGNLTSDKKKVRLILWVLEPFNK